MVVCQKIVVGARIKNAVNQGPLIDVGSCPYCLLYPILGNKACELRRRVACSVPLKCFAYPLDLQTVNIPNLLLKHKCIRMTQSKQKTIDYQILIFCCNLKTKNSITAPKQPSTLYKHCSTRNFFITILNLQQEDI